MTKITNVAIHVKLVGLTSNYVYFQGLATDNQNFNLSNNTIGEEIGYFLSTKELVCTYINLPGKNITMLDFSRIRCTWSSANQLQNNDITTCIWGGTHLLTSTVGYDFSGNANFTSSMLPSDTASNDKITVLNVAETKVTDIYFLLNNFENLRELFFGNSKDNFEFLSPITSTKLANFTIKWVQNSITNLTFTNCPMLKFIDFVGIKVLNISIDNCPLFESINAWNNTPILDINRTGSSKIRALNIGGNSFTSSIKDKLIDYCVNDGVLNGNLAIGKTPNPPTNATGLSILRSRGWTGTSLQ
ncbi:hypothetical protein L0669_22025 [Flavobacterium bizetiae]|uniref:hypothetical protein n=1 Tax=Flavobacterium bizetiae TaxID=2704140 RepID=UPI0021E83D6D|nr:hypothetical protein [Flavobacterium bizetiae]UTN03989.1 hypothetical protein L0669_22025 [Flavobacterium bizetiae]